MLGGLMQARYFIAGQFLGECDGREFGGVEDLVGVGVADSAEEMRIGQRAFESVIFRSECLSERLKGGTQDLQTARIERLQRLFTPQEMQRGALLCAGFGQLEGSVRKFECGD